MLSQHSPKTLPLFQEAEFLPPISRWIHFGGLFVVATVALAFPLSAVVKYKSVVRTQAIVRPTGELRVVQAAAEGAIQDILIAENQQVKQGDVIATIDDSHLQTQKNQLLNNIQQAELQLTQLNAQIHAVDRQILAESHRIHRSVVSAEAELAHRQRQYRDQQIVTVAEVEEATAALRAAEAAYGAAQTRRNRYRPVAEAGALSQDEFEEAQLAADQQAQEVEAAKARLQSAQAALHPSSAEVAIASEKIAQESAAGESTLATLNKEQQSLVQQRAEVEKQLENDRQSLQQTAVDLNRTVVTAPADGILFQLNLRNSNQIVRPGEAVAQVAPSASPLVLKAIVPAQDISKVEIGHQAQMRVAACPYPDYGTLKGEVTAIAPDTSTPQNRNGSDLSEPQPGVKGAFYEVTIKPDRLTLGRGTNQCEMQLGMEGRADIVTREETVLQFLLRKARLIADL
ncbi:HlyD family efflux transporter periplasmic adaptor subunit [Leptolyngbya sp. NK1-12]|uniref:HlyD family efflux transporter periplasmic adaptor subunit n=1 Tax=Leptolyngbya sp. NK1-12 TaxID=2547451 RepID=A0AA96WJ08_9CYAN|nr:HlyD family efflux transporter periplasmic adaptor subunit [Leptolyngbya sp. NK1-12]